MAMAMSTAARAASPPGEVAPPEAASPTLEDAQLTVARDLARKGEASFRAGDYRGAIEAWTQVLVLLPDEVGDLPVELAHAHRHAYVADEDVQHLQRAKELLDERLAELEPDDASRAGLEAELAEIDAELAAVAEAEAEARAEREEAIRQEQIRLDQRALAAASTKHWRNTQTIYFGMGGAIAGVGVGSLAAMTVFLVGGAKLDREGQMAAGTIGVADGYYAELLAKGEAQNRAAVVSSVIGGVLTLTGGALLIVAAARRQPARGSDHVLRPGFGSVELRF
jgi:tetratricopeptide (TPR) repeat protein